jgi:hypothetical protein
MVQRHCLAPDGHGKIRIDILRLDKCGTRIIELETMQQLHATLKGVLCIFNARIWKIENTKDGRR